MKTKHRIYFNSSANMKTVNNESVDLIVTSPPYPMIEMWDEMFFDINPQIRTEFEYNNFMNAFYLMHEELNKVWKECNRVLKEGGIICVNIGDATRTLNKDFQLYSNHTITNKVFMDMGLKPLPIILWRKTSNKPNKFMGSGMLPTNAYVTLEHEYILIFRKGDKRKFNSKNKNRYESAYFWEERNNWFSDVWFDLSGISQNISGKSINQKDNKQLRKRSAAYPIELVYRLIAMFSSYNDTVLDPFWGTGTTTISSMMLKRNSIGFELVREFRKLFKERLSNIANLTNKYNQKRFSKHLAFIEEKEELKYKNIHYDFGVLTSQEKEIRFYNIESFEEVSESLIEINHKYFFQPSKVLYGHS